MADIENISKAAQDAMRASRKNYWVELENDVHISRNDTGTQKILKLIQEYRANSLFMLAAGKKESFDANQATWKAWDRLIQVIEQGTKTQEQIIKEGTNG